MELHGWIWIELNTFPGRMRVKIKTQESMSLYCVTTVCHCDSVQCGCLSGSSVSLVSVPSWASVPGLDNKSPLDKAVMSCGFIQHSDAICLSLHTLFLQSSAHQIGGGSQHSKSMHVFECVACADMSFEKKGCPVKIFLKMSTYLSLKTFVR